MTSAVPNHDPATAAFEAARWWADHLRPEIHQNPRAYPKGEDVDAFQYQLAGQIRDDINERGYSSIFTGLPGTSLLAIVAADYEFTDDHRRLFPNRALMEVKSFRVEVKVGAHGGMWQQIWPR